MELEDIHLCDDSETEADSTTTTLISTGLEKLGTLNRPVPRERCCSAGTHIATSTHIATTSTSANITTSTPVQPEPDDESGGRGCDGSEAKAKAPSPSAIDTGNRLFRLRRVYRAQQTIMPLTEAQVRAQQRRREEET